MSSRAGSVVVAAALVAAGTTTAVSSAVAAGTESGEPIRWAALGDSYSAGEGIPGLGKTLDVNGKNCQRANRAAWAAVAAQTYAEEERIEVEQTFTACTGAIGDEVFSEEDLDDYEPEHETDDGYVGQIEESGYVGDTAPEENTGTVPSWPWDIATFSFGGNNVGFGPIVHGCIDSHEDPVGRVQRGDFTLGLLRRSTPRPLRRLLPFTRIGCDVTLDQLRPRLAMLLGGDHRHGATPDPESGYRWRKSLADTYDAIAGNMKPGGDVIVVGYPQVVAPPSRWTFPRRVINGSCGFILAEDVPFLREPAHELNTQVIRAVAAAKAP